METQKIVNLLNSPENACSKFATTKKQNIIDNESKSGYLHHNPIKLLTKSIESGLCDSSNAHILVTRNITVTATIAADPDANPAVFKKTRTTTYCSSNNLCTM